MVNSNATVSAATTRLTQSNQKNYIPHHYTVRTPTMTTPFDNIISRFSEICLPDNEWEEYPNLLHAVMNNLFLNKITANAPFHYIVSYSKNKHS